MEVESRVDEANLESLFEHFRVLLLVRFTKYGPDSKYVFALRDKTEVVPSCTL